MHFAALARGTRGFYPRLLDHVTRHHRHRRLVGERPAAVLFDADRHRLVAPAIEVGEHRRCRGQGHFVFTGPSAVEHADAQPLHVCQNTSVMPFEVTHRDGQARRGTLTTPHGVVQTPAFMPVGTRGAVKAITHRDLEDAGTQIILGNTYHLHLRPGDELIARRGGLHAFIGWPHPILTDSGGYQVFSLAARRRVTEARVEFRSHLDGALCALSPEKAADIQAQLGSDIAMVLDELVGPEARGARSDASAPRDAMERSARWARRGPHAVSAAPRTSALDARRDRHQSRPGAVRHQPGRHRQRRSGPKACSGHGGDRVRGLCDRRPQRWRAGRRHVRRRRTHRALTAGRSAALLDGDGHARRPRRVRRARDRHVRLRAADPQRTERPAPDAPRGHGHQERPLCRGPGAPRSGLRLLYLRPFQPRLFAPSLHGRRDDRGDSAECPKPLLLP